MLVLVLIFLLCWLNPAAATVQRISNGVVTVGVETNCGGTISEILLDGVNIVNNFDCTGRQIQAAVYDGNAVYDNCAGCTGTWGWNPVQGGDRHNVGSVVLDQLVTAGALYIKTQPYQWNPDDKGGGPGVPVLSDVIIQQWISFVPGEQRAVKVRYTITHLGADSHALASQEFPAVYLNGSYGRFIRYAGASPWTSGAVTEQAATLGVNYYASEFWAAFVNAQNKGLTLHVPAQYPWTIAWHQTGGDAFNYLAPFVPYSFGPGAVMDGEFYLYVGDYTAGRQFVYKIQNPDTTPPYGFLDTPAAGQSVSGVVNVGGWAFDNEAVSRVEILVDGTLAGNATYGQSRPDVGGNYPSAPVNIGYTYSLDTVPLANGSHTISARAVDAFGNSAILLKPAQVTVSNGPPPPPPPPPSVTVGWMLDGWWQRDRVRPTALTTDGVFDPVFTVTLSAAATITRLRVTNTLGDVWDTQFGGAVMPLGATDNYDSAFYTYPKAISASFKIFIADVLGHLQTSGVVFTLTVTFSDGSQAQASL